MILKNDNYHGIVEAAHDRLGAIIEEITKEESVIYIHNPPASLNNYLMNLRDRGAITLDYVNQKYLIVRDSDMFVQSISSIKSAIFGQDEAIFGISRSLWYLTHVDRKKPYVIMLYGESSLGKTELVREVAKYFFNLKYMEKHLSMFRNPNYSDYFFGDKPNRRSLGFDLLERESNLVFLDEIDKCPEYFYSAFYTLFDNTLFQDCFYEVDISGLLIVLTSNYVNMEDMKKELGLPIYYRIDRFLHFENFTAATIHDITLHEIDSRSTEYQESLTSERIYRKVSSRIQTTEENARTIKNKVQDVIEELLFSEVSEHFFE